MDRTLATALVERLAASLRLNRMRLVTAESCTGGGLAYLLTSVPGSSDWFERGFVTYSNAAKRELLEVPAAVLEQFGAVSEQAAAAMAEGALAHSHANVSVSITGIAGPDGGTPDKPVGTVYFAWSRQGASTRAARIAFAGDRQQVREQSILMALQGLLDLVEVASP
ncbi:MAG: CinA family protein [Gammaproteobacteria bacterium]|nr:CinA family protein [Gammaproteobacteria bacterium]